MKKLLIPLTILTMLFTACAQTDENTSNNPTAVIKTNQGDITLELFKDKAPETVTNFLELAKQGKYDKTIFHRVINDFMIQGGDIEHKNGFGGYSYKGPGTVIQDEFGEGLTHEYGVISMANAGPNTGSSQFFIVQNKQGTAGLDGKHAIFGKVTQGMDVVEKIAKVETNSNDKPLEDITIETITIDE